MWDLTSNFQVKSQESNVVFLDKESGFKKQMEDLERLYEKRISEYKF